MAVVPDRRTLLTPAFLVLTVADLLYFMASGVLIAATPVFARDELLADDRQVGLVMGAFSITTLLLRPYVGRWSDRNGRRLLVIGGAGLFAVIVLAHLAVGSLPALVVLRLLLGAAEAAFFVAGFAALADLAPPDVPGKRSA